MATKKKSKSTKPRSTTAADENTDETATRATVDDAEHAREGKEGVFVRDYTILAEQWSEDADTSHFHNDVRQHCINRGLRPLGEVRHVDTTEESDGVSLRLTFEVDAVAAEFTAMDGAGFRVDSAGAPNPDAPDMDEEE